MNEMVIVLAAPGLPGFSVTGGLSGDGFTILSTAGIYNVAQSKLYFTAFTASANGLDVLFSPANSSKDFNCAAVVNSAATDAINDGTTLSDPNLFCSNHTSTCDEAIA